MLFFILLRHNTTSRFVAWLGAFTQERQVMWLPKDDHQDSSSLSSPPLVLLRDIHNGLLAKYDSKDSAPPPDQSGERACPGRNSQDGVSQQEASTLLIPQLKKLPEAFHVRGEDTSNLPTIPLQKRFTRQILKHLQPFKDLKETFATVPCSFACARSSALYLLKRTQYCVRR
jgi:hypothetical protein